VLKVHSAARAAPGPPSPPALRAPSRNVGWCAAAQSFCIFCSPTLLPVSAMRWAFSTLFQRVKGLPGWRRPPCLLPPEALQAKQEVGRAHCPPPSHCDPSQDICAIFEVEANAHFSGSITPFQVCLSGLIWGWPPCCTQTGAEGTKVAGPCCARPVP